MQHCDGMGNAIAPSHLKGSDSSNVVLSTPGLQLAAGVATDAAAATAALDAAAAFACIARRGKRCRGEVAAAAVSTHGLENG